MHLKAFLMTLTALLLASLPVHGQSEALELALIAEGFDSPLYLADPGDGSGRLFVVDQAGIIHVLTAEGELQDEPLLDISEQLAPRREGLEERGLLGFALHPEFPDKSWLYIHYSAPLRDGAPVNWNHTRRVSEFSVSADDPNRVNPDSERVLLELDWPTHKHNGGGLAFGPDGYLYIGLGDGGGVHGIGDRPDYRQLGDLEDDERWWAEWHHFNELAQDLSTLFGKVLRIDVEGGFPGYSVPGDNPLVGEAGRDEIFAWGFRQPYRLSFDTETGDLFVSATSEIAWETIYRVDGPGNYGWPIREGSRCVDIVTRSEIEGCPDTGPDGEPLHAAIVEYANLSLGEEGVGSAVVGGYVYRGGALPELEGQFVFADWSAGFSPPAGQLFAAEPSDGELWSFRKLLELEAYVLSMGQDASGELYLLTNEVVGLGDATGKVYKLVPAGEASAAPQQEAEEAAPTVLGEAAGWYTAAQASTGREAYIEHCAACHETNMGGAGPFPPITGASFMRRWEGRSALELYGYIHDFMPLGAEGSLSEETYLDILAHWLNVHGYPSGEQALTDPEELEPLEIRP